MTSILSASLLLSSGLQRCRKRDVLNTQSGGWDGSLCSIVILFLMFHNAQLWAANKSQIVCLKPGASEFTIVKNSWKVLGFHCTPKAALMPLHAKAAKSQTKKIWSTDSSCPQSAQLPLAAPCLLLICSLEGNLPFAICQRKILILSGSLALQRRFSWGKLGPWLFFW
jgi:hypothetical protein